MQILWGTSVWYVPLDFFIESLTADRSDEWQLFLAGFAFARIVVIFEGDVRLKIIILVVIVSISVIALIIVSAPATGTTSA